VSGDPKLDELLAYAKQMGLMNQQPTAVDPNVDHFAQSLDPLQQYLASQEQPTDASAAEAGQAHPQVGFAIPGTGLANIPFDPKNNPPAPLPTPAGNLDVSGFPPAGPPKPVALQAPDQSAFTDAESSVDKQARVNAINAQAKPGAGAPPDLSTDAGPPGAPMRPPVIFGPSGGLYVPPRQVDLLNPTGKDDTNRVEYDAGWNDQFKALNERNMDLERQTSDRMESIDAQKARMQAAYDEQRDMLNAQLKAQQDHAAAMANAKQWADSAADAAQKEAANATVDQGHFFASRGAGQQIALVIGAALGALGSSLTNTPNYALQMIQGAMADDMQAQQANLANKRASANSALKRAMDATGDLDAAKNLVRLQQLQVAQNTIDQYSKMDLADDQKAKLMEIHDGLKAQILDTRGRMMQDRAVKDMQLRPMVGGGYVGGSGAGGPDQTAGLTFVGPDGQAYAAATEKDKTLLAGKSAAAQDIAGLVSNIEQVTKQDGWRTNPQARAQLSSYFEQLWLAAKDGTNGMNSENDAKVLQRAIGDPFALLEDGTKVAKRFAALRNAQFQTAVKTYSAEPVQKGYTVNPATGAVKPTSRYTGQSPDAGTVPKSFKPGL